MDPTIRLRIATRIHFALLRHYGEDVPVSSLLKDEGDAREALWVCVASGIDELHALAEEFGVQSRKDARASRTAVRPPRAPMAAPMNAPRRAAVPQEMAWSQNTTGFGVTRPMVFADSTIAEPPPESAHWLSPARWLRRGSPR